MSDRLEALRDKLKQEAANYDGLFISKPENRAYLTGFTGSFGYLLVTPDEAILFTDGRYTEQAASQAPGWKIVLVKRPFEDYMLPEIKRSGVGKLGFEAEHLNFNEYHYWSDKLQVEFVPTSGVVGRLRQRKDKAEVEAIQLAIDVSEKAFDHMLGLLHVGMSERDAAVELEFAMRRFGADAIAFDTITASGARGALPHGRASEKLIEAGDFVTFDFGARLNGYNADITRTVFVGGGKKPTDRQLLIYNLVLESQLAGIEAVKPGASCKGVDDASRAVFEKAGMLEYYLHSTGHSLGREVHEAPFMTPTDTSLLEPGMVLTVEPGLYISEWGGVRIEDDLVVSETGAAILPHLPKELLILP